MGEKIFIVGYRDVNFKDDSGRAVSGRSYYYTQDGVDNVVGVLAAKIFVSSSILDKLPVKPVVGDTVIVYYNRFGKPASFEKVASK